MALSVGQRIGHPVGQQPRAHRGDRAVEHAQQRALAAAVADRAGDFQAAAGRLVDLQRAGRRGRGSAGRCARAKSSASRSDSRGSRRRRGSAGTSPSWSKPKPSSAGVPKCFASASRAAVCEKAQPGRRVSITRSSSRTAGSSASSASRHSAGPIRANLVGQPIGRNRRGHEPAGRKLDPGQPGGIGPSTTAAR